MPRPDMTKGAAAAWAITIYLGGFSTEKILDHIELVRRVWLYYDGPQADLDNCAPLIILSGVLLHRLTGIMVLTEDTAEKWLQECQKMADSEGSGRTPV